MKLTNAVRGMIAYGTASEEELEQLGVDGVLAAKSAGTMQHRMAAHDVLVRKDADETRTVSFIASDETVDRMGDIIRVRGWDLANFRTNPIILWQHNGEVPIGTGKATKGQTSGGNSALLMDIKFAAADASEFAEQVFQLVKAKVLKANSVGFMPIKTNRPESQEERDALGLGPFGVVFEKAELFEDSVVSVPANPSAVVQAMTDMVQRSVLTQDQADLFLHDGMGEEPQDWFGSARKAVVSLAGMSGLLRDALEAEEAEDKARDEGDKGDDPEDDKKATDGEEEEEEEEEEDEDEKSSDNDDDEPKKPRKPKMVVSGEDGEIALPPKLASALFEALQMRHTSGYAQTHTLGYVPNGIHTLVDIPWNGAMGQPEGSDEAVIPLAGRTIPVNVGPQPENPAIAKALTKLAESQTDQITATRQLVDVVSDLARKVLDLNGKSAAEPIPGGGAGDEEIDPDLLRTLGSLFERLALSAKLKG